MALLAGAVLSLVACGSSTLSTRTNTQTLASSTTLSPRQTPGRSASSSAAATAARTAAQPAPSRHPSRLKLAVARAKQVYNDETRGPKLNRELSRIARDGILLGALSRGDIAGAQAAADAQLHIPLNHTAHVTRIGVDRGSHVLVNATINADGVFVVAPADRAVSLHGHALGTLLVSIQDVTGFVKLVHHLTGADVLVRGASGRVRTTLGAAIGARLPASGSVTIAGSRYFVRSFDEIGWGNERSAHEALRVWVLERA